MVVIGMVVMVVMVVIAVIVKGETELLLLPPTENADVGDDVGDDVHIDVGDELFCMLASRQMTQYQCH